jgi:hypothetical protein
MSQIELKSRAGEAVFKTKARSPIDSHGMSYGSFGPYNQATSRTYTANAVISVSIRSVCV